MVATEANGQPAAVAWFRGEPSGVAVLTVAEEGIVTITLFGSPKMADEPPRVPWRPQELTPTTSRGWC
jgi:hypothetical protein